jgi:hypothetical protein
MNFSRIFHTAEFRRFLYLFFPNFLEKQRTTYLAELRSLPELRSLLAFFTFCTLTSRCVTNLMMLKWLKILKNNVNWNIHSYFNILHFFIFFNNYSNLWPKNGSPKRQKAVLFTQQAGGDLKNNEKHFYYSTFVVLTLL